MKCLLLQKRLHYKLVCWFANRLRWEIQSTKNVYHNRSEQNIIRKWKCLGWRLMRQQWTKEKIRLTFSFPWHLAVFRRLFGPLRSWKKSKKSYKVRLVVICHVGRLFCPNVGLFMWTWTITVFQQVFFVFTFNLLHVGYSFVCLL